MTKHGIFQIFGLSGSAASHHIFYVVGIGLLLLGGASGIALFVRAVIGKEKISEGPGMGTLWGLFVTGILAGIVILATIAR